MGVRVYGEDEMDEFYLICSHDTHVKTMKFLVVLTLSGRWTWPNNSSGESSISVVAMTLRTKVFQWQ